MEFFHELLITGVLSILLAFLLGKIFSISDDDLEERDPSEMAEPLVDPQFERTKICGGGEATVSKIRREVVEEGFLTAAVLGSDRIEASEVSQEDRLVKDSFDLQEESEEEKRFGVNEVRFDEISTKEMPEEVEIERLDAGFVQEEGGLPREKESSEDANASKFSLEKEVNEVRLGQDSVKEMPEVVGTERINGGLLREEERNEVRLEEDSAIEMPEVVGTERINGNLLREEERSEEARASEFDIEIREGMRERLGKGGFLDVESEAVSRIHREVVEKAAAVLGADGIEAMEVSREDDEEDRLEEGRLVKDSFDLEKECEDKKFGANGDRLDEVSAKEKPDEVEVERIDVDLVKGLLKEKISPEKAKASEFGLEKEVNEVSSEQNSAMELPEVVGTERIDADLLREEERLLKEEETSEEARAGEFDLEKKRVGKRSQMTGAEDYSEKELPEEVEVEIADVILHKDNKCEEKIVESTEREIVLKEGSESEIRGEQSGFDQKEPLLFDEEDEWEGIERTELDKLFSEAAAYVGSGSGGGELSRLSNDEQMQLYGLHKVATEGPCYDPQPMALKVSARTRWHAWQRLGNMNPEVAMEQYMNLLSEKIPRWKGEKPGGDIIKHEGSDSLEPTLSGTGMPELCSTSDNKLSSETERKPEGPSCIDEENESAVSKDFEQDCLIGNFAN